MKKQSIIVGGYVRLSRDDHNFGAKSMSIENQEKLISSYVAERGWKLYDIYSDDGFTGTNFNRPDFKRMLKDLESGIINCVITKDLSRFGRNYVECGKYTDEYFPEMGVRFIAINDGVDTEEDNEMMAFHHVVNEFYPRQVSKKVRQVRRSSAYEGKFMGSQPPYGYIKSPLSKHLLIPDPSVYRIVQRIFVELSEGYSARNIAERLTAEGVDCPRVYQLKQKSSSKWGELRNEWGSTTIMQMSKNQAYVGDMVQGKRSVISFKTKKRRSNSSDEWIVVENTHEPIVSRELWIRVQEISSSKKKAQTTRTGIVGLFSGVIRCADCGARMSFMRRQRKHKEVGVYRCSSYNNNGNCSTHNIWEDDLIHFILNDIHSHALLATRDRANLIQQLTRVAAKHQLSDISETQRQLSKMLDRLNEINRLVKSLYEDKAKGDIPLEFFKSMAGSYAEEKNTLEASVPRLQEIVTKANDDEQDITRWVDLVSHYLDCETLDRSTVMALVESIEVADGKDGNPKTIKINYRFIGRILDETKEDIA